MKPTVDDDIQLQKFCGKGGWTYAPIKEIRQNPQNPFGWVTVSGFIDDYELKQIKLMPMGEGQLFLPVKASIRQAIRKQAGDFVRVVLYLDNGKVEIPADILACFQEEPAQVLANFYQLPKSKQRFYLNWIASAKTETTKAKRIAEMLTLL